MNEKKLPSQEIMRRARVQRAPLVVRGMPIQCWRCKSDDMAVVVIHHDCYIGTPGYGLVITDEELSLAYARELLQIAAHPQAETIKVRFSRTASDSYLSNGCTACDSLFGASFVSADLNTLLHEDAIGTLPVLATVEREALEWYVLEGLAGTSGSLARCFEDDAFTKVATDISAD
ncbi:hypothetical protein M8C13_06915 [Crossiella sp. SN42]|uniref:hypothetical protein n=1 Tax=Crossiella sp. SN42 TaxID=2944808 RepID=UPI00207CED0B|nr:hypothetical protein [Crossiella sp. SN42]MCO1575487.1 hypothetical protein [Crossiella sp. SN42]